MNKNFQKSHELFKQAQKVIPGGVNSPVRAFGAVGGSPIFFEKGQGAYVFDADDNSYIDYCGSWGPLILGHAHPQVVEATIEAARDGLSFGACNRREVALAKLVLQAFPQFDMARFVSSGTEAVMTAIRLARGITQKPKIIKFDGCYHGHADHLLVKAGSGLLTQPIASSSGVPATFAAETLVASLDSEQEVEELFKKHPNEIAAIIIEPLPGNSGLLEQRTEFLQFLRDITQKHNSLLIFDEVISGFRLRYGGYMHEVDIVPDIVTLGKIVGGGMPVGALLSSKENMSQLSPLGNIYQAGTLSGNPVAMAAGMETLKVLSDEKHYQKLESLGNFLDQQLTNLQKELAFVQWKRLGSLFWLYLDEGKVPRRPNLASHKAIDRYNQAHRKLLHEGVYFSPSAWEVSFLGTAHTEADIEKTVSAWRKALLSL